MCTAISFLTQDHYFGRNLDLEFSYQEAVTITPRGSPFHFHKADSADRHYALIGMATVSENYPLYYDAVNEKGLAMAGLNFPGNAYYDDATEDAVAPYELIPWVLRQCETAEEAVELLKNTKIGAIPFSAAFPLTPLHWMIADKAQSFAIESLSTGLNITADPFGVLTNSPPFEYHLHRIIDHLGISDEPPENRFAPAIPLSPYSRGMGAIGLPGDLSSGSRFIRAAFTKLHSVKPKDESLSVNQFFHILGSVCQQEGCVKVGERYEKTVYSSCCNTNKGIYYYTTYENSQVNAVYLHREDLDSSDLIQYPIDRRPRIHEIN